jgi:hypothetical protein
VRLKGFEEQKKTVTVGENPFTIELGTMKKAVALPPGTGKGSGKGKSKGCDSCLERPD